MICAVAPVEGLALRLRLMRLVLSSLTAIALSAALAAWDSLKAAHVDSIAEPVVGASCLGVLELLDTALAGLRSSSRVSVVGSRVTQLSPVGARGRTRTGEDITNAVDARVELEAYRDRLRPPTQHTEKRRTSRRRRDAQSGLDNTPKWDLVYPISARNGNKMPCL